MFSVNLRPGLMFTRNKDNIKSSCIMKQISISQNKATKKCLDVLSFCPLMFI